jgi:acyl transferase domain-containing protein
VALVFQYPSIREQAKAFSDKQSRQGAVTPGFASVDHGPQNKREFEDIAVVGMSCRFPGANDIESFWRLLVEGQENITFFDDDKIPVNFDRACRNNKQYIRAKGLLSDTDLFDADFFGLSHQMAEVCDPQIRLFLEHSYKALENSGHVFYPNNDIVGAYAGMGRSLYLRNNILSRPDIIEKVGELQIDLGNEKDFLATRLSHSLNLTGPSISISTACSTSLVAIILACHAIHRKECTIALAGGCEISIPLYRGHLHQEGSIFSCDGHCRPFDAAATGTTFSDGVGVVVLKKLSQALEDHNIIYAVIKGAAINNDGAKKVSYSAPGVDGQVNVIASAQKSADLPAETISYIETHGTATPLGDPIEIDSLTQAFRKATNKTQFCAIGSVKSNIGHTGVAAGVAGFIKTTQMLYNKTLVPSLNFKEPNPGIDFDASPFFVNTKLAPWKTNGAPRRAGVSSFGFGGTNAHVILEEAPPREMSGPSRPFQMLPFSAKTESALSAAILNFKDFLTKNPETSLPDCAYTLQAHRTNYLFRRYIVCRTNQEARATITSEDTSSGNARTFSQRSPSIVFMFPGQGTQYATMGAALYSREPAFRAAFDRCAAALRGAMGEDILDVLFSADPDAFEKLKNTYYAQPALFTVEYALACLWQNWGLKPHALVGHSIGEFVAACVSGIMEVEGAAALVAARARLMSALPPGAMLSVRLPESEILPILPPNLSIAAVNSPVLCVVSGPLDAIEEFKTGREKKGVACRPLHTSHAFHSAMVDPIIPVFNAEVRKIRLSTPTIPIVSTVTGKLLTNNEATDPEYWTRHMRVTVRFSDAIKSSLDSEGASVFLEVGPRATCVALVNQHIRDRTRHHAVASLSDSAEQESEYHELINATGQLWIRGVPIDWGAFYKDERRLQGLLPAYPFDRQRYWIEPASPQAYNAPDNALSPKKNDAQTTTPVDISPFKAPPPAVTVADTIRGMITESMGDVSGPIDGSATFLQMGMDSLFLTQLSQRIKTIFGVSVSMRQLMREYATIGKLADFIAKEAAANGNT